MGLWIIKTLNGISGIDINHIFYAEKQLKLRREREGKELRPLPVIKEQ